MTAKLGSVWIALGLLMVGCGDSGSTSGDAKAPKSSEQQNPGNGPATAVPSVKLSPITPEQLRGKWETPCVKENSISKILSYEFGDGTYQYTTKYFKDKECKKATREWMNSGTYALGSAASKPEGAVDLDFVVEKSFITIRDEAFVKQQNDAKSCGKSDWKIDVSSECPMEAGKVFTVVGMSEDKLYFGDARTGGADAVNRMSKADAAQPFARK